MTRNFDERMNRFFHGKADDLHEWMGAHLIKDSNGNTVRTLFYRLRTQCASVRLIAGIQRFRGLETR